MRFRRWPGVSSFEDTLRKRSALARRQQAQREKLPLLSTHIAEQQPDAGEVMAQRAEKSVRSQQEDRNHRARLWRRARAQLALYGDDRRRRLIALAGRPHRSERELLYPCQPPDPGFPYRPIGAPGRHRRPWRMFQ